MLKVYIIQLKGKNTVLIKMEKRERENRYSSLLVPNKREPSFLVLFFMPELMEWVQTNFELSGVKYSSTIF
jgi:hypothetical protein